MSLLKKLKSMLGIVYVARCKHVKRGAHIYSMWHTHSDDLLVCFECDSIIQKDQSVLQNAGLNWRRKLMSLEVELGDGEPKKSSCTCGVDSRRIGRSSGRLPNQNYG